MRKNDFKCLIRNCKTRNKILNGSHPKILWLVNTFAVVTEQKVKMSENLSKPCLGYISPQSHKNLQALERKFKPTYVIVKIINYFLPDNFHAN